MPPVRTLIPLLLLIAAAPASAQMLTRSEKFEQFVSLDPSGSITIENPNGSITVTGTNTAGVAFTGVRTIRGLNEEAIKEGQGKTVVQYTGDSRHRFVRTLTPFPLRSNRWDGEVSYNVRVPVGANVTVINHSGERLRVTNVSGNVLIKHVNGMVELTNVSGLIDVDTANGSVQLRYPNAPQHNAAIDTINGSIQVWVPENSSFEWQANTLRGTIASSLSLRGAFMPMVVGRSYRARLNSALNPKIITTAIMGRAALFGNGQTEQQARVIIPQDLPLLRQDPAADAQIVRARGTVGPRELMRAPSATNFVVKRDRIDGNFAYETNFGNVFIGELTGDGRFFTGAGEIVLGRVLGSVVTRSGGGELNIGDVAGLVTARTVAGDVLVRNARKGGTLTTEAGNIQVNYSGGRISLFSGGGSINLRQAAGPVKAESRSGDITINMDPAAGSQPIEAKSVGGNIVLNLSPGFGANIDATVTVPVGTNNPILSEFSGLEISTERVGDQIRTRAVGKINGGGPAVVLNTDQGSIHLRSRAVTAAN